MSEFKGTPGPWKLMPFSDSLRIDSQSSIVAFGADKDNLSMVYQGEDLTVKWEEERANAQLIAAAPELLEALKACLSWVNNGIARGAHVKAQAAITKALGETK